MNCNELTPELLLGNPFSCGENLYGYINHTSTSFFFTFMSDQNITIWKKYSFETVIYFNISQLAQVLMKVLTNVEACVLVGGCVLAVDLLTVVHEASERTAIPLQSNLIAATAFMEPLKEWMFLDKDGVQAGPVEKDAIRRLWSKKEIDWTTRCWATGMPDWKKLRDIRELRWTLAVRVPVLTPTQVSQCFHFDTFKNLCFNFPCPILIVNRVEKNFEIL